MYSNTLLDHWLDIWSQAEITQPLFNRTGLHNPYSHGQGNLTPETQRTRTPSRSRHEDGRKQHREKECGQSDTDRKRECGEMSKVKTKCGLELVYWTSDWNSFTFIGQHLLPCGQCRDLLDTYNAYVGTHFHTLVSVYITICALASVLGRTRRVRKNEDRGSQTGLIVSFSLQWISIVKMNYNIYSWR